MGNTNTIDFLRWFDIYNPEHLKAYKHLMDKGSWPKDFLPSNVVMPNLWQTSLAYLMAQEWVHYQLYEKK